MTQKKTKKDATAILNAKKREVKTSLFVPFDESKVRVFELFIKL